MLCRPHLLALPALVRFIPRSKLNTKHVVPPSSALPSSVLGDQRQAQHYAHSLKCTYIVRRSIWTLNYINYIQLYTSFVHCQKKHLDAESYGQSAWPISKENEELQPNKSIFINRNIYKSILQYMAHFEGEEDMQPMQYCTARAGHNLEVICMHAV